MIVPKGLLTFLLIVLANTHEYQLQFDWKMNKKSTDIDFCTVTWNGISVATLKELQQPDTLHHQRIQVEFKDGINEINFFFIGLHGQIIIDNVMIIKPPKNINFIVNGDFQLSRVHNNASTCTVKKIPGWSEENVSLVRRAKLNINEKQSQALILNSKHTKLSQRISFGKVNKYSFISTFDAALKQKAQQIFAQNVEKYASLFAAQPSQSNTYKYDPSQSINTYQDSHSYFQTMENQSTLKSNDIHSQVLETLNNVNEHFLQNLQNKYHRIPS